MAAWVCTPRLITASSGAALIVAVPITVTVRCVVVESELPVSCASDGTCKATIAPSTTPATM